MEQNCRYFIQFELVKIIYVNLAKNFFRFVFLLIYSGNCFVYLRKIHKYVANCIG